jgi:hypothetical protein
MLGFGPGMRATRAVARGCWHRGFRWLRGYVFCGGFLDGAQGWKSAKLNARAVNLKYNLLRQMNIAARE